MKHGRTFCVVGFAIALASTSWAQVTRVVSVSSGGTAGNSDSGHCAVSADGLSIAFYSSASNLLPGDTNGVGDVFLRDWTTNANELISVDSSEVPSNGPAEPPAVSADGNYVAFASAATNLVPGDTNGVLDVFVRHRPTGATQRVSISSAGVQANGHSYYVSISANARYIAFASDATNLVSGDTNGVMDVFVRDIVSGVTERVSLFGTPAEGDGSSIRPSISADGRYVAFASFATNYEPNGLLDVFVRDRQQSSTGILSMAPSFQPGDGNSDAPSISADGRSVAFVSTSSNLLTGDTNGVSDIYWRNVQTFQIERLSVSSSGTQGNGACGIPSISADGRYVGFSSDATNLVSGDTNGVRDVFVRDLSTDTTERVSIASNGAEANGSSDAVSISGDGRFVAFSSNATNLAPGDSGLFLDAFVHDRDATGFTSLCEPGVGGVLACPCSNPPTLSGRGCDNSAATGGAYLSASGIAYLSMDSLVFTTYGERQTALSVVLQGKALVSSGLVYGQGVRCVGGTLKRLYAKTAALGSITAPQFGAGDPSVSARSAAKGDPIQAGQSRWYLVYYRDPAVLGNCPAGSTFNTTQTGHVRWMP